MEIINSFTGSFVGRTGSCRSAQRRYRGSDVSPLRISRCEGWLHPHLSPRPWWTKSLYSIRCLYCTFQRGTLMGRLHSIWESVGQGVVRWVTHPHWHGKKKSIQSSYSLWHAVSSAFFQEAELGELFICLSRAPTERREPVAWHYLQDPAKVARNWAAPWSLLPKHRQ